MFRVFKLICTVSASMAIVGYNSYHAGSMDGSLIFAAMCSIVASVLGVFDIMAHGVRAVGE